MLQNETKKTQRCKENENGCWYDYDIKLFSISLEANCTFSIRLTSNLVNNAMYYVICV